MIDGFGVEQNINANDTNSFRYAGEYYDKESKTIYLRARYYSSSIGRFTQEDPIKDGYNWYVYCNNNPVNLCDPSGLFAISILIIIGICFVLGILFLSGCSSNKNKNKDKNKKEFNTFFNKMIDGEKDIVLEKVFGADKASNISSILNYTSTSISLMNIGINFVDTMGKVNENQYITAVYLIDCCKCIKDSKEWVLKFDRELYEGSNYEQKIKEAAEVIFSTNLVDKDFFEKDAYSIEDLDYFMAMTEMYNDVYFLGAEPIIVNGLHKMVDEYLG